MHRQFVARSAAVLFAVASVTAPALAQDSVSPGTSSPGTSPNAADTRQPPAENRGGGDLSVRREGQIPKPAEPELVRTLPDQVRPEEVKGQYGIGLATLIIGAVFAIAVIVGLIVFLSRRSWAS